MCVLITPVSHFQILIQNCPLFLIRLPVAPTSDDPGQGHPRPGREQAPGGSSRAARDGDHYHMGKQSSITAHSTLLTF